jgi:hypothetical protein
MLPDALQGIVEKPEKFVAHPVTNLQPALHPAPLAQTGTVLKHRMCVVPAYDPARSGPYC